MSTYLQMHPSLTSAYHKQRQGELEKEARNYRLAASLSTPNRVERFFLKRREGKVTRIETVLVQRSA